MEEVNNLPIKEEETYWSTAGQREVEVESRDKEE